MGAYHIGHWYIYIYVCVYTYYVCVYVNPCTVILLKLLGCFVDARRWKWNDRQTSNSTYRVSELIILQIKCDKIFAIVITMYGLLKKYFCKIFW